MEFRTISVPPTGYLVTYLLAQFHEIDCKQKSLYCTWTILKNDSDMLLAVDKHNDSKSQEQTHSMCLLEYMFQSGIAQIAAAPEFHSVF